MNYQNMTLSQLKQDLICDAQKGYPIFLAGALYWLVMGVLGFYLEGKTLALWYLLGTSSIFPLGILISRLCKVNFLSKNPLGTLGGIIGGIQAFYLPLWIVIYMEHYEWIPMAIGLLGASHFLPYIWIYESKTYLFFSITMALISVVLGYVFIETAFLLLPFSMTLVYLITAGSLKRETRNLFSKNSP
ncbi:DUF7010 family protein [Ammoniphilus resinae]|uniref:Uncharacterized protein n=1 Tax=Ammoniphilus resinae TaxID=861532 RepID=A0ABS4GIL7_9BACL|nr:hypothetical protein [Ammoniphilus resinae]MBP1930101.1 hypothetical protein [Ammoniphilus resinae]